MVVMGFHPTARGFGWVVFEQLAAPYDWGLVYARGDKNAACLRQLRLLLERHRPEYLALERVEGRTGKRASRLEILRRSVLTLAGEYGVEVRLFDRREVSRAILGHAEGTRQQVAEAVADHVHAFSHRLPPKRRPWESVDPRLALFGAAALALTTYAHA